VLAHLTSQVGTAVIQPHFITKHRDVAVVKECQLVGDDDAF